MMDFSQSTLIGVLKDTRSRQWGDSTSDKLNQSLKLVPYKEAEKVYIITP